MSKDYDFNMNRPMSRRAMLRGLGATLALPWLEAMMPSRALAAGASGSAPLRMAIHTVAGGTVIESWKTPTPGPLTKLPSILASLEAHKDRLLLVSGLGHHGRPEGLNAHEHCAYMHLTGCGQTKKVNGKPYSSISVDQLAAKHLGHQTFLPSLEISTSRDDNQYCFRSENETVPFEDDPRLAYERLFRGRPVVAPDWKKRAENEAQLAPKAQKSGSLEQSVLDLVREDAKRLQSRLGGGDRAKMDQYLESVRSVERRIAIIEHQAKQMRLDGVGKELTPPNRLADGTWDYGEIQRASNSDPELQAEYIDLMSDIMILSLQTDSTRVVTFSVGSDGSLFPGVVTVGFERHFHTLEHQGGNPDPRRADPIAREACRQISKWFVDQFSRTVEKMSQIDEGGRSLLDNTMLLYTSYMADGGHHRHDFPVLFVGDAQGTLKTGRHVAFPHGTPMANLFVEMLDRMGVSVGEFGDSRTSPGAAYDGRLPGLV